MVFFFAIIGMSRAPDEQAVPLEQLGTLNVISSIHPSFDLEAIIEGSIGDRSQRAHTRVSFLM